MTINLNTDEFARQFSNAEQLAILSQWIESAYRYDFERIARNINMEGRTLLAGRGGWRTRNLLTSYLLYDEPEFRNKYQYANLTNADFNNLNRKREKIENTLQTAGFSRWVSEFLQVYSLNWIMSGITHILSVTRPGKTQDNISYDLKISLEGVR